MLGILVSFWGPAYFQGLSYVSFREGTTLYKVLSGTVPKKRGKTTLSPPFGVKIFQVSLLLALLESSSFP